MTPETRIPDDGEQYSSEITSTTLFAAFSAARRKHALAYLTQKPVAIPLGDLAEFIALKEGEPSYDWYERVLVDLYHNHLPHLTDADLVEYDEETELVKSAVSREVVAPYLNLSEQTDS
ncbi:DUF7344 domain-containing protein [Natronorubrum halophilum]|uniref:DUF7344 domain-containing protein n=1 Tax=Natronorubrum halophilum TaxID=1702106 RepID=UPI001484DB85|nr:hypothetical protein [Natronorubrum halophilum]